jgi:hypothetical protein
MTCIFCWQTVPEGRKVRLAWPPEYKGGVAFHQRVEYAHEECVAQHGVACITAQQQRNEGLGKRHAFPGKVGQL